ncbi:MAG: hypothetical protein LC725_07550, partial [Lentisphaerae bacterium]|nr:hypothetical protein [Lentisphaerota bacterium]
MLRKMQPLHTPAPAWQPSRAPGYRGAPAGDARREWRLFDGWTKLTVPSVYEDIEGNGHYTTFLQGYQVLP